MAVYTKKIIKNSLGYIEKAFYILLDFLLPLALLALCVRQWKPEVLERSAGEAKRSGRMSVSEGWNCRRRSRNVLGLLLLVFAIRMVFYVL